MNSLNQLISMNREETMALDNILLVYHNKEWIDYRNIDIQTLMDYGYIFNVITHKTEANMIQIKSIKHKEVLTNHC